MQVFSFSFFLILRN